MPKGAICPQCSKSVPNLKRHVRRHHSSLAATNVVDGWMDEELCVIDPPDDAPQPTTGSESRQDGVSTIFTSPLVMAPSPRADFVDIITTMPVYQLVDHPSEASADIVDAVYSSRIRDPTQRWLCDCQVCVSHAADILDRTSSPATTNAESALRFVNLPGIDERRSDTQQREDLLAHVQQRRLRLHYACSCTVCVVHRILINAWTMARGRPPF